MDSKDSDAFWSAMVLVMVMIWGIAFIQWIGIIKST